jgi:hypothetical protein
MRRERADIRHAGCSRRVVATAEPAAGSMRRRHARDTGY